MDITVAKKDLLRLVGRAQAVADKKSTQPVLANVLLDASGDDHLVVSATDLYISVSGSIPADVRRRGSVAVPAKDLLERTKMMPDGPLLLVRENENTVLFKAEGSKLQYRLHSMPGSEFPTLPTPSPTAPRLELRADVVSTLIARTQFSISLDDTRANLHSALFEWQGDRVRMVTTDGHRLTKMEVSVPDSGANATMLIPLKAIVELRRLAEEARADNGKDATVTLIPSEPNAYFEVPGAVFAVKLVDAQFPSYRQVIPKDAQRSASAPRVMLANALRAVSLAASDRTGGVKLSLTTDMLRITSESPESGDGLDEIPVEYGGVDMTIGFNAKYLLDVIGAIDDDDTVKIGFSGELDPAVLRPGTERAERDYIAVVMPMRI
jgi:DNA polymerase-3 subunit beta